MSLSTTLDVVSLALAVATCALAVPFLVYGLLVQLKHRQKGYVHKRRTTLIFAGILAVGMECVYIGCVSIQGVIEGHSPDNFSETYIHVFVGVPGAYLLALVLGCRLWLLYYDINLSKLQKQRAWLSAIDPSTTSQNWFKRHESRLANDKFLLGLGLIMIIIVVLLELFLRLFLGIDTAGLIARIVTVSLVVLVLLFLVIIWCKLGGLYQDALGIKQELGYAFKVCTFYGLLYTTAVLLLYSQAINVPFAVYTTSVGWIQLFWFNHILYTFTILPGRLSKGKITTWMKIKFTNNNSNSNNSGNSSNSSRSVVSSRSSRSRLKLQKSSSALGLGFGGSRPFGSVWTDIVCTQFGFESLMDHLEKEFAIETLLFVAEYVQLKDELTNIFETEMKNVKHNNKLTRYSIQLPPSSIRGSTLISRDRSGRSGGISISRIGTTLNNNSDNNNNNSGNVGVAGATVANMVAKMHVPSLVHLKSRSIDKDDGIPLSKIVQKLQKNLQSIFDKIESKRDVKKNWNGGDNNCDNCDKCDKCDDYSEIDKYSIEIGQSIMNSFEQLYDKYVSDDAEFMINVQSRTRKILHRMFDKGFYQMYLIKQAEEKEKEKQREKEREILKEKQKTRGQPYRVAIERITKPKQPKQKPNKTTKGTYVSEFERKDSTTDDRYEHKCDHKHEHRITRITTLSPRKKKQTSFSQAQETLRSIDTSTISAWDRVKFQYKSSSTIRNAEDIFNVILSKDGKHVIHCVIQHEFIQQANKMQEKHEMENELLEWLLSVLIISFDAAAREISILMNDSFARFAKDEQLLQQAIDLAFKFKEKYRKETS